MSAMTLIEHIEVGSGGAAEIEFTSIPQTYTDLYLVVSGRSDNSLYTSFVDDFGIYLNGSSANQTKRQLFGEPTSVYTNAIWYANVAGLTSTANTFGNLQAYIPNYTASQNKSVSIDFVTENNAAASRQGISAMLWSQTTAVSSITLDILNGDFVQYSSATLYGVTSGSDGTTTVS